MSFARLPVLRHGLMLRHEALFSDTIFEGRIKTVRQLMNEKGVKSLMAYSNSANNGSVCYLTHYPCYGLLRFAVAVLGLDAGPFLFTFEPSRNLPRVRRFTFCDLEKTRDVVPRGCERALELAAEGPIGVVNGKNMSAGLFENLINGLNGRDTVDLTPEFSALLASKDEPGLKATTSAVEKAEGGLRFLTSQSKNMKNLRVLAAAVDRHLRLQGCEDAHILIGPVEGGKGRPGLPGDADIKPGDLLVAYVAVQHARYWGASGTTLAVGERHAALDDRLAFIDELRKKIAGGIKPGLSLGEVCNLIVDLGNQAGITLAQDVPPAHGTGFDLQEYPSSKEDKVGNNTVLQVALAEDVDEGFTAMRVGLLQVTPSGGIWLGSENP